MVSGIWPPKVEDQDMYRWMVAVACTLIFWCIIVASIAILAFGGGTRLGDLGFAPGSDVKHEQSTVNDSLQKLIKDETATRVASLENEIETLQSRRCVDLRASP